jgi:hypothetical protein
MVKSFVMAVKIVEQT